MHDSPDTHRWPLQLGSGVASHRSLTTRPGTVSQFRWLRKWGRTPIAGTARSVLGTMGVRPLFRRVRPLFRVRPCFGDLLFSRPCLATFVAALVLTACLTPNAAAQNDAEYTNAIRLLPDTAAGLVRIPNLPKFCEAFEETHLGTLRKDELLKPFVDAQRARLDNFFDSVNNNVGIKPEDLYEMASGEVVFAWLPFPGDQRRPYSLVVVTDIRGRQQKADETLVQIDQELKQGGWTRSDVTHQGELVRLYGTKPKPGQLKIEQIAITANATRVIAADRDTVVTDILDAVSGTPKGNPISDAADFRKLLAAAGQAIAKPVKQQGGTLAVEWFARPFAMGRIARQALEIDRGNDIDIIKLLENQGFDAIQAAGGVVAINGERFDVIHKGMVLAERPFQKAARMLQFEQLPRQPIPAWIPEHTASFNRIQIDIENAFWSSGTLVDEALGDPVFNDMIAGIRDDQDGPQIDLEKDVLPNLDDEIILLTDNVLPADVNSERMLVAIRVKDEAKIKDAIRKAMEVEPDASKMETDLQNVDVWRVQRGEGQVEDFDDELFGDLDLGFDEEETEEQPPLLDRWAIALIPAGPQSNTPFLMFSSHPELLIAAAERIQSGADGGFGSVPAVDDVTRALQDLGINQPVFDRVVRTDLSLRVKYELLREGKLRESDSVLANLLQRIDEQQPETELDRLNAEKLPPYQQIEKYLPAGGSYLEETPEGWELTSFLLK